MSLGASTLMLVLFVGPRAFIRTHADVDEHLEVVALSVCAGLLFGGLSVVALVVGIVRREPATQLLIAIATLILLIVILKSVAPLY